MGKNFKGFVGFVDSTAITGRDSIVGGRVTYEERLAPLLSGSELVVLGPYKNTNTAQVIFGMLRKKYRGFRFRRDGLLIEAKLI